MTGWFSIFGSSDACYRTSDGGSTWTLLPVPGSSYGASAVYYRPGTNRLFLSMANDSGMKVSTDLGDTWLPASNVEAGGISFSSDSIGIAAAYPHGDTSHGIMRTTDAGATWSLAETSAPCEQPLSIPESPICFEVDGGRVIVRRSDDYGQTWRVLSDFGPFVDSQFNFIAPCGIGVIRGDLSRLYIQTDSGMYLSTDEGITWRNDGGPGRYGDVAENIEKFYSAKGVTFAGSVFDDGGTLKDGGLWEEDWGTASVAEPRCIDSSLCSASVSQNPLHDMTTLRFDLSDAEYVRVEVFDVMGNNTPCPSLQKTGDGLFESGQHQIPIDFSRCASGTYYLRITLGTGEVRTIKLVKE
ncbi:MAG: hypothetical protein Q8922_12375 [Bacteroidota bacterium]|nr:hypothetical protein [Bacteroidota bacterium]MDP4232193.1 hypothetical protein [Bacteroidota bacterium]MDP4243626.1 hypothetical protein [Bacteroidota bacterium]MDP4288720.1 hypothetical protein [Bacteroidota bacterium]